MNATLNWTPEINYSLDRKREGAGNDIKEYSPIPKQIRSDPKWKKA